MRTPTEIANLCRLSWGSQEDRQIYAQICSGDIELRDAALFAIAKETKLFIGELKDALLSLSIIILRGYSIAIDCLFKAFRIISVNWTIYINTQIVEFSYALKLDRPTNACLKFNNIFNNSRSRLLSDGELLDFRQNIINFIVNTADAHPEYILFKELKNILK